MGDGGTAAVAMALAAAVRAAAARATAAMATEAVAAGERLTAIRIPGEEVATGRAA